ncbi:AsnC family transcriptional regulator [Halospina denitrificans]|uniref:Siroheme decarboxylase NirL subunit n=1 Tax=Halospina denitrificans TaxID=332522 RepID=A0A4R7JQQ0_9GAMM|nr:AsnC family protein [Halospina denitrificans]TDT40255.1 AsnC family transcriptional regulator [Halospina denitrificans]
MSHMPRAIDTTLSHAQKLLMLRRRLETGLPLCPRPYQALAEECGLTEEQVLDATSEWQADGLIKRMGLVVRHRTLGYRANAMVVWNLPDEEVATIGNAFAEEPFVTLCYQRPRQLPDWPYNLFCMIHGTDREQVLEQLRQLRERHGLEETEHAVLFSRKAYRQCGGRYVGDGNT